MYRMTGLLAGVILAGSAVALGQEPQLNQEIPENAFSTRDLIAWTSLQKPQPAPQPLPPRDTPIPQPDQPQDQKAKAPAGPQSQQSPAQSFTGRIVKEGAEYVLKGENTTYQLDQQSDASRFENKNVKVTGNLDAGTTRIHVLKIELLS
jgi:glucan-binding YG repeat protein